LLATLVALAAGAVFLVPALVYLYVLFQRSPTARAPVEPASDAGVDPRPTGAGLS
jgi:hypothetical protein